MWGPGRRAHVAVAALFAVAATGLEEDDSEIILPDSMLSLSQLGFPPHRIPLQELNFCDIGWNGMQRGRGGWRPVECPKRRGRGNSLRVGKLGPSCMSCLRKPSLVEGERLWQVYSDPRGSAKRRAVYTEWFGHTPRVLIIMSNQKYLQFTKMWWCYAEASGLSKSDLLVYALDSATRDWAHASGLRAVEPTANYTIAIPEGLNSAFKWSLFPVLGDLLRLGKHVFFSDIDMIWIRDLTKLLPRIWPSLDIITQLSPRWDAQGTLNSGVLALRPHNQTIVYVETLMSTTPIFMDAFRGPSDQLMWNILLRHHKFRSLTWRTLPRSWSQMQSAEATSPNGPLRCTGLGIPWGTRWRCSRPSGRAQTTRHRRSCPSWIAQRSCCCNPKACRREPCALLHTRIQ